MGAPALPPPLPPPLPRRKSGWKVLLGSLAAFVVVAMAVSILRKSPLVGHEDKLRTIEALSALRYPEQAVQAKPLCTEKGFALIQAFEGFPGGYNAVSFKTNPKFCDVEMFRDSAEGKSRIHIRLARDNGRKFEDVYFNEVNGKKCGQWASYIRDHPIASTLQYYADDFGEATKTTLDVSKSFLEVVNEFKKLEALEKSSESASKKQQVQPVDDNQLRMLELLGRAAEQE